MKHFGGLGVQPGVRFVQQEHLWIMQERTCDRHALHHPAGKRAHQVAAAAIEAHPLQHCLDALFGLLHAVQPGEKAQVLLGCQAIIEEWSVRNHAQVAPDAISMSRQVQTADADRATTGPAQAGKDADKRRLARAVRPEDHKGFAGHDAQTDSAQRMLGAEGFDEVSDLDHRGVGFTHPCASLRIESRSRALSRRRWSRYADSVNSPAS